MRPNKQLLLGILSTGTASVLFVANFWYARHSSPPPLSSRLIVLAPPSLIGLKVSSMRWQAVSSAVPRSVFVLPRFASCSKTPPSQWPKLLMNFRGEIISPNYASEWPIDLGGWMKSRQVLCDPEGMLIPAEAFDAGPVQLTINQENIIVGQSFSWPGDPA